MFNSPPKRVVFVSMLRRRLIDSWKVQYPYPFNGMVSNNLPSDSKADPNVGRAIWA